jgi:MFS superfamily sulfate permease-like transporter
MVPLLLLMMFVLINFNSLISVVGFLDSIAAAKQNGARFGYSISPNRELVALGVGNLVGSFIPGTLPAFGSITRYGSVLVQIDLISNVFF